MATYFRPFYRKASLLTASGCAAYFGYKWWQRPAYCQVLHVKSSDIPPPSKCIMNQGSFKQDFSITLFQYQTCPFCSKVRAFLDYYGLGYDVVEVNPLFRNETKFSPYRKTPFLLYKDKTKSASDPILLPDSSLIVSLLMTLLMQSKYSDEAVRSLLQYYPQQQQVVDGKDKTDYANKYFVMYEKDVNPQQLLEQESEAKWRRWVDDHLVHTLAPNIYRSPAEAVRSFKYLAKEGEWHRHFPSWQVPVVIYVGAVIMYIIGKRLKKRYNLSDDVRISLYEAADEWVRALGQKKFMGGEKPNLADLAAFGVLNAIEGCEAFLDLNINTNIAKWYQDCRLYVTNKVGHRELNRLQARAP